jgi:hypothetical protein
MRGAPPESVTSLYPQRENGPIQWKKSPVQFMSRHGFRAGPRLGNDAVRCTHRCGDRLH